jgi:F420-dependent oxidoreductase-like protein
VSEGWYGQPFERPLARLEDYVAVIRKVLRRERLEYTGKTLQLPLPGGPGKPLKLLIEPIQEQVPIYLAAVGPQALRLTGRIADGWLGAFFCPEHSDALVADIRSGAAGAGRDLTGFEITPTASLWIDDDHTAARNRMRHSLALYVGGMGSRDHNVYANLVRHYGFEAAAAEVQELYLAGRKNEAAAALPEKLIDQLTLCGPPGHVQERLAAFAEVGVTTLILSPATTKLDGFLDQLRRVSALT